MGWPTVPVKSSIKFSVSRLSIKPTSAMTIAYGKTISIISQLRPPTSGIWKIGRPPLIEAISPTVLVSKPIQIAATLPIIMAANVEGTILVNLGKK